MARPARTSLALVAFAGIVVTPALFTAASGVQFTDYGLNVECGQFTDSAKPERKDLKSLIKELSNQDEFQRTQAVEALANLGPRAAPAVPELIKALASKNPLRPPFSGGSFTWWDHTPAAARKALVRIGPAAVPHLESALQSKDTLTRVHAASALWAIKKEKRSVLPLLLKEWRNRTNDANDVCIRREATDAIGLIAQEYPDRLLPIILKALEEDEEMGYEVTVALTILGKTDSRGRKHLLALMGTKGDHLYRFAAFGLRDLRKAGVPLLIEGLKSGNPELRLRCAWALGGMKSTDVAPAVSLLRNLLHDEAQSVRESAGWALGCIEKRAFDHEFD